MSNSARKVSGPSPVSGQPADGRVAASEIGPIGGGSVAGSSAPPARESGPVRRGLTAGAELPPPPRLPAEAQPAAELEVLFSQDADPTADDPLTYRERAYLVPGDMSIVEAEEALFGELEQILVGLEGQPLGRFVVLSMFEQTWEDRPTAPPVVVIEWKDWRGAPVVRYPAAEAAAAPALTPALAQPIVDCAPTGRGEQLVVDALAQLPAMVSAAAALDHVAGVLEQLVPCDALCACLYGVDSECLHVVAARGHGARARIGAALPRTAGLLGAAVHIEDRTTVFDDPQREPGFDVTVDTCPGLDVTGLLVRPISRGGQLLGALQLINRRRAPGFDDADVDVIDHAATQLAAALVALRRRSNPRP